MKKQLYLLICLTVLATALPSCRNRKKETTTQKEEINTKIELDSMIFEEEETTNIKIIKF